MDTVDMENPGSRLKGETNELALLSKASVNRLSDLHSNSRGRDPKGNEVDENLQIAARGEATRLRALLMSNHFDQVAIELPVGVAGRPRWLCSRISYSRYRRVLRGRGLIAARTTISNAASLSDVARFVNRSAAALTRSVARHRLLTHNLAILQI
jgi:hypothetical protein